MKRHKNIYFIHKKCNFCGNKKTQLLFRIKSQSLVRCTSCLITYFDKQRIDFENLYSKDYYSAENDGTEIANYADYQLQEQVIRKHFHFAYEYIKNNISKKRIDLLEIGAGFGYFSSFLPKSVHYEANEISEEAITYLKKKKHKIYKGDFLKTKVNKKYDVIVAFDVIEHQIFLREFLKKVHSLLKDDGILILTTPDFSSLPNKLFGKNAPTIQPRYHNYYFDKKWFIQQLPKMKLLVVSIRTSYITYLSVAQILLLGSFAIPIIKRMRLAQIAKKINLEKKLLLFFRFGGIECIIKKN